MKQEERSQETQSRILAAAEQSFAEHGYDVTSVDSICRAAGVSKGAFYHHFPSKGSVFVALLNAWLTDLDRQFVAAQTGGESVPQQVAAMAAGVNEIYHVAGTKWSILLEFWAKSKADPKVAHSTVDMIRRYQGFFQQVLERGVSEGSLQVNDSNLAATLMLSVVLGLLLQGILDPEGQDWGTLMQRVLAMLMESMGGRKP
ncbi:MAG: TetR/AcrR family transcriptional regulator [Caldiserica bacterium]|nr:TetR/AcrR family transcriptional regulator [Caldisericota bacterium]